MEIQLGEAHASPLSGCPVFDVHLHAFDDLKFFEPASEVDFGVWSKTAHAMVADVELLAKTLEFMDENNVKVGLISGDNHRVQNWRQAYPNRFCAGFVPDLARVDHTDQAAQFEREVAEGKWRALGELTLAYAGKSLNDEVAFPLLSSV